MSTICLPGPTGEGDDRDDRDVDRSKSEVDGHQEDGEHSAAPRSAERSGRERRESRHHSRARRRRTADEHIPERKSFLAFLVKLPQLVATRVLTPAEANSIHAQLRTQLQYSHADKQHAGSGTGASSSLRDMLRANPALLEAWAPMLSDDQLNELADDEEPADGA